MSTENPTDGLTPEQREIAKKAELIIDNVKLGMGGSNKEIHGFVVVDSKRYYVRFEETKHEDLSTEHLYTGYILGERDEKGNEYTKRLEGNDAKKFFLFYQPIAKPRHDFESVSNAPEPQVEDSSIEDKLLGGK